MPDNMILDCENKVLALIRAIDALQPVGITRANRDLWLSLLANAETAHKKLADLIAFTHITNIVSPA